LSGGNSAGRRWETIGGRARKKLLAGNRVNVSDYDLVIEIGGGYGSMCRLVWNLGFRGKYAIYDLPVFSVLQRLYLSETGRSVEIGSPLEWKEVFTTHEFGALHEAIDRSLFRKSIVIATWSLSESPDATRERVERMISDTRSDVLIAYQERFAEMDNIAYFDRFRCELPSHSWQSHPIPGHAGNYYLFGCVRDDRAPFL